MGKKGEALRQAKMDNTRYTFTKAQLMEHDKAVASAYIDRYREQLKAEAREYIDKEFKAREEALGGSDATIDEQFMNLLSFLLCTSSRVLIEKFGWKPIPKNGCYDRRNRTMRFGDLLIDELNKICEDDTKDIRVYAEETYEKYGIKFIRTEE